MICEIPFLCLIIKFSHLYSTVPTSPVMEEPLPPSNLKSQKKKGPASTRARKPATRSNSKRYKSKEIISDDSDEDAYVDVQTYVIAASLLLYSKSAITLETEDKVDNKQPVSKT